MYFYTELAPQGCEYGQELDPGQSCNVAASAFPEAGGAETGTLDAVAVNDPDGIAGDQFVAEAVLHVTGY